jgi:hypothetical protein
VQAGIPKGGEDQGVVAAAQVHGPGFRAGRPAPGIDWNSQSLRRRRIGTRHSSGNGNSIQAVTGPSTCQTH